jgi:uncharacterized membrane protein YvbJ
MYCWHCGTQLPNIARFCSACGQQVPLASTSPFRQVINIQQTKPTNTSGDIILKIIGAIVTFIAAFLLTGLWIASNFRH